MRPEVILALRGDSRMRLTASVVLPDPLSPMIASVSPRRRSKDTSRTAWTASRRVRDREALDREDLIRFEPRRRGLFLRRHAQPELRRRGLKMSSSAEASQTRESWNSAIARTGLRMYQRLSRK